MFVFAFDRDWTVDVNPHPQHDAVPLEWVRHLAHETDHVVYAIGNQTLAEEAAIPGVIDIVGRHSDDWDRWLGEKKPDGRYERFPTRRERLSLIADLHPGADGYVVIDDLDLSDVDGWDHYHAWKFVPAVEHGEIESGLPWVREPVTDGGQRRDTLSGPMSHTELSEFLDEHDNAPAYELTHKENGERRTELCYSITVKQRTLKRPAAAVTVACTPIAPTGDRVTLRVDSIEKLATASPPPSKFTGSHESLTEQATGLVRLASAQPNSVSIPALLSVLETADANSIAQRQVLSAVRHVASVRPDDCCSLIPMLRTLLNDEETRPGLVFTPLRVLCKEVPAEVAPAADEIAQFLRAEDQSVCEAAAKCIAAIAAEHPTDVVGAVSPLAALIDRREKGLEHATYTLAMVAKTQPEAVEPVTETLRQVIVDDLLSDYARMMAIPALGHVVKNQPSEAVDIADELVSLLDAEELKLKNNAIGLLSDIALVHTDAVEPHVEEIATLLSVDDDYARINTSCALARVAEDFPESVEHLTPRLLELLNDSEALVRKNACWALGYLRPEDAAAAIEERMAEEPDPDVHARAAWALDQVQG